MANRTNTTENQETRSQTQSRDQGRSGGGSGDSTLTASPSASTGGTQGREQQQQSGRDRERQVQTSREGGRTSERQDEGRGEPGRVVDTGLSRRQQQQQGGLTAPGLYGSGSPFAMMRRMFDDMDRLFADFGFGPSFALSPLASFERSFAPQFEQLQRSLPQGIWSPQVEVFERGDRLVVRADLPGLSKDDVDLEIENDVLTIRGERKNEFEDNRDGYYRSERSYGSFHRSIPLPEGTNAEEAQANFQNGVLEVTLPKPKQEQRRGRKIEIRS